MIDPIIQKAAEALANAKLETLSQHSELMIAEEGDVEIETQRTWDSNDLRLRFTQTVRLRQMTPEERKALEETQTNDPGPVVSLDPIKLSTSEEVRTVSSTGGEKGAKPQRFSLLPVEALEKVAELYGKGAAKYAAHNWRRGYDWSKSYDALMRHANAFWRGEDIDEEMQTPHMAAVAFHALTLLTFMEEQPEFDDRYKKEESNVEENHSNHAGQQQGSEEGPGGGRGFIDRFLPGSPYSGG